MAHGGDFTCNNGTGGQSIYGTMFKEENLTLKHDKPYLLTMANSGPNTDGSQSYITFIAADWLNGKNVVFGKVIDGVDVVKKIEVLGMASGKPIRKISIQDCGVLPS